ncbi:MAG: Hsp70 family protein [Pseudonocardiales bacterium]|nr:Hsp70 family protein [Pseudonocardiales bacterium]MBV9649775.1 Hsp70 family protein [Pseudonocardiales bacterium]
MGYSLGVDLGTTFVAAAVSAANRVKMIILGDYAVVVPAAVYLRDDGVLIAGDAAGARAVNSPERVARDIKRRLGNPTPVILGGQHYGVTELLGVLLHHAVEKVVEVQGERPERVLLTHPANWGPFRRVLFEEVPQHAGLDHPSLVTESEAAAANYAASRKLAEGQVVAVYDLGGGTFDATILRKQGGGVEILGTPEGIERMGGVDFDDAIRSYVDYAANGVLSELDLADPQTSVALARLHQDCVAAKEALSVSGETVVPVFLPDRHLEVRITRAEFEDLIRASIESTISALSRTLASAQVDPVQLSAVLLVGGSSRIPLVARMVSAALGCRTVVDAHPTHAVALGAATLAAQAPMPATGTIFSTRVQRRAVGTRAPAGTLPEIVMPPPPPTPQAAPKPKPPPGRPTSSPPTGSASPAAHRPRRPWLVLGTIAALVAATAAAAFVLLKPASPVPQLTLSTCQVRIGETYVATASGFSPGENVRFSWTGPTNGVMGAFPADQTGTRVHGGILEKDPPGTYAIFATGMTSGHTSTAGLVVTDTGTARLALSSCQVPTGQTYSVSASGFAPGENVRITWTGARDGLIGTFPADAAGACSHQRIPQNDPPGTYTVTATGLASGRTTSAGLQVLPTSGR